ncbi:glycosyltransferase [Escherichia coli]|uniref:glycosyltransferase n=1 Tax=Escherichia coli TaxID=562 RepID=UPI0040698639
MVTLTPVFLLINTNQWTNERVSARAIAMLSDPEIVKKNNTHPDQDVLNMLLADKLVYADIKYNTHV